MAEGGAGIWGRTRRDLRRRDQRRHVFRITFHDAVERFTAPELRHRVNIGRLC